MAAAIVNAAGVTGIYSVAMLPKRRGHGYGEMVMRYALVEAARERRSAAGAAIIKSRVRVVPPDEIQESYRV